MIEHDELMEVARELLVNMLDMWIDSTTRSFHREHYLDRLSQEQFDRLWDSILSDLIPYGIEKRGKDWPQEPIA